MIRFRISSLHLVIITGTGISVIVGIAFTLFFMTIGVPQSHPVTYLKNDTGTVALQNKIYYFETPSYSDDAYSNSPQISFHGVTFTLFPVGFRGGLPIPCNNQGAIKYYWVDAQFSDNSHELLHIQVDFPPCGTNPMPAMFSKHTNPQAGLISYDGKMKLLTSVEEK